MTNFHSIYVRKLLLSLQVKLWEIETDAITDRRKNWYYDVLEMAILWDLSLILYKHRLQPSGKFANYKKVKENPAQAQV